MSYITPLIINLETSAKNGVAIKQESHSPPVSALQAALTTPWTRPTDSLLEYRYSFTVCFCRWMSTTCRRRASRRAVILDLFTSLADNMLILFRSRSWTDKQTNKQVITDLVWLKLATHESDKFMTDYMRSFILGVLDKADVIIISQPLMHFNDLVSGHHAMYLPCDRLWAVPPSPWNPGRPCASSASPVQHTHSLLAHTTYSDMDCIMFTIPTCMYIYIDCTCIIAQPPNLEPQVYAFSVTPPANSTQTHLSASLVSKDSCFGVFCSTWTFNSEIWKRKEESARLTYKYTLYSN